MSGSIADEAAEAAGPLLTLLREIDANREEAVALASGLTPSQLWWRPEEGRWSVGECLDHLVRTGEAYLDVLDEAIEAGWERRLTGHPPFRRTLLGRWIVRTLEPPPGLKIRAPSRIRPRRPEEPGAGIGSTPDPTGGTSGPGDEAPGPGNGEPRPGHEAGREEGGGGSEESPLPRFLELRSRLSRRLGDAKGLDAGRVKVRSPFVPLLRVDLVSAFRVVVTHERRHLWQARRVKEEPGFPEG